MQVSDKLLKPLTEVKYLNADNVSRYRCIMRIFYENNEKLNYWLYQEDVYEEMKKDSYWSEYTIEQCQQDLASLVEWKNLNTMQDTKKVASIEEFKNKKYRYQISEYSVQIERLVLRLENLLVEGASLEPTLLERIRRNVEKFSKMVEEEQADVNAWWNDLNSDFVRLNQNYQDYIRDLNSVRAEEMMHTKEFMVFKDRLIEYLRSFIKGLQRNVGVIDWQKQTITDEKVRAYADMEMDYRKFVKKHYLALSKKAKEEVAPYVPQKKDNLVSYIEKIRSSLKNAGKEKGDWDALQYASLGTLAFRAANIPARYVEGYEAVTSDEKDANGNYRADVTGQNAHAWVEIYCDGVGWLPVDVTPGHYDKITVKAKQQKKIEKQQTSISQKVTKKKEKPKQNEAPNKYLSWQQIILWIVICIFAVSFLFAGVLAIRRKAIVYKRRKTLMQADTAADYRFIISYLTTLFAYLKLSEEDLPREIREGMERFWFDENGEITEKELSQLREYGNEIQNTMWQESSCIKKLVLRFWHCFEFPF